MTKQHDLSWALSTPRSRSGGHQQVRSESLPAGQARVLLDEASSAAERRRQTSDPGTEDRVLQGDGWLALVRRVRETGGPRWGRELLVVVGSRLDWDLEARREFIEGLGTRLDAVLPINEESMVSADGIPASPALDAMIQAAWANHDVARPTGVEPTSTPPTCVERRSPFWPWGAALLLTGGALAGLYIYAGETGTGRPPAQASTVPTPYQRMLERIDPASGEQFRLLAEASLDPEWFAQALVDASGSVQPFALLSSEDHRRLRSISPTTLEPVPPEQFGPWLRSWRALSLASAAALLEVEKLRDGAPSADPSAPVSARSDAERLLADRAFGQLAWFAVDACGRAIEAPSTIAEAPFLPTAAEVGAVADLQFFLRGCGVNTWHPVVARDPVTGAVVPWEGTDALVKRLRVALVDWRAELSAEWNFVQEDLAAIRTTDEESRRFARWVRGLYPVEDREGRLSGLLEALEACTRTDG